MHFENLLFILLIAMAALLRLLATKAGGAKGQKTEGESTITPKIGEPIKRVRVESDQERIRKFLEALGQPTTAKPPPPIVPRTGIPPRPMAPVQPPPIPTARNVLTRRKKQVVEPTKFLAFEHHETPPARELPASIKSPVEPYAI